ncbi:MAG: MMPL family transporter [Verrucomicrobiota bacterium]
MRLIRLHPLIITSVCGLLAALSLLGVRFSADLYEIMPADLPEVRGMDEVNRFFSRDSQLIITIESSESALAEDAVASLAEHLEKRSDLVERVDRERNLAELVNEGGALIAWLWLNAPEELLSDHIDSLSETGAEAKLAKALEQLYSGLLGAETVVAGYDPFGFASVAETIGSENGSNSDPMQSQDGTFRLFYLEGTGADFSDYRSAATWLSKIREEVDFWEAKEGERLAVSKIGLTGTPAFMAEVGAEMERDMTVSVVVTIVLISLLFWIMHRRPRALAWLMAAMMLTLAITLSLGAVLFGELSVMSAGFAAILMGLAVDYGIVLFRESMNTGDPAPKLRRTVGPSILWAGATTAVVFLSLNFSSLPGLAEMGNLVALGIAVGAIVMLFAYAPVAVAFNAEATPRPSRPLGGSPRVKVSAAILIGILALATLVTAWRGAPKLEANFHPFRIRESPSMIAWQEMRTKIQEREGFVPLIVRGSSLEDLTDATAEASTKAQRSRDEGLIDEALISSGLLPAPERQRANAGPIAAFLKEQDRLTALLDEAGFSEEGTELTDSIFEAWSEMLSSVQGQGPVLPVDDFGRWTLERVYTSRGGEHALLGAVRPTSPRDRAWVEALATDRISLASIGSLGVALNEKIRDDLWRVFLPMLGLLVIMLAIVFRSWRDLCISLFSLGFSAAVILLLTEAGLLSWNSFNLCGVPLLFGTGIDFSIHMVFSLRRNEGNVEAAQRGIGKALLFCGSSSAIGFGSLATASAYGLASLGVVCGIGILVNMIVAIWLLPSWYRWIHRCRS